MLACLILALALLGGTMEAITGQRVRDFCEDGSGSRHGLYEEWEQGDQLCRCIYPESRLYFWDWQNPSDAISFCQINGCRHPTKGRLLKVGRRFLNFRGDRCVCQSGTMPYLMDTSTLYHVKCRRGRRWYYMGA